jgi:osmotically-inducible protein OsmY
MLTHRIKRMPVVGSDGRLVGIVSRADLISVYDRTDRQISADIYELVHVASRPRARDEIRVDVRNATVTLTGRVSNSSHRRAPVAAVRAVPGVVAVTSQLEEGRASP